MTSWVATSMPPRLSVMPGDGAVCPATVIFGSRNTISFLLRSMMPPTSNTTMRGPLALTASAKEPGPDPASVVTRMIFPPRPPGVCAAQPTAPGKARSALSLADGVSAPVELAAEYAAAGTAAMSTSNARRSRLLGQFDTLRCGNKVKSPSRRQAGFIVNDTGFLYTKTRGSAAMNDHTFRASRALAETAERFVRARLAATALTAFPGEIPTSLEPAYACQDAAIGRWPDEVQGWKVGRINEPWLSRLGEDRLVGPIFARSVQFARGGDLIEFPVFEGGFAAVEAEFIVRLAMDAK